MIVISDELVGSQTIGISVGGVVLNLNNPVIGWRNVVTTSTVNADSSTAANPVLNVANPSTYLFWESAAPASVLGVQFLTISVNIEGEQDYVAIAGHNFGSANIAVQIEGATVLDSSGDPDWMELTPEVMPADDTPMLFRFKKRSYLMLRIRMELTNAAPRIAVVYCGDLLILERRIYVGHQIISFNTTANIVTGRSELGQFLGRLVLGEFSVSQLDLKNLTPLFYRNDFEPFRRNSIEKPFFFAWRPLKYPFEVGYCWTNGDVRVSNQTANGYMQASLQLQGITE